MPGPDSDRPGFYGKLPAGRRLRRAPPAAPTSSASGTAGSPATSRARLAGRRLCFHFALATARSGATGVVLASADRAGRRFPLTLAAPARTAAPDPAWLRRARRRSAPRPRGELGPDALDARLLALPLAAAAGDARRAAAQPLDRRRPGAGPSTPSTPSPILDALLAAPAEAR